MSVKVNRSDFDRLLKQAPTRVDKAWQAAGRKYRDLTPVASGNARRRTRVQGNEIRADYAYADRLDKGWSKQAPQGMTEPTLDYFESVIDSELDKL